MAILRKIMSATLGLCASGVPATLALYAQSASAFETPTMGWSSWNTYHANISDSLIMRQADMMVKTGLAKAGYTYINIDDGFQGGRDEVTGELLINPYRFPNGLKPVVDHIHSLGLKAGIYSDAGENTCANYFENDTLSVNVGLYGHEEEDCDLFFNRLGFDFIKVDYCGSQIPSSHKRYWFDTKERYQTIHKAMEATGRKGLRMNVCRWAYPGAWVNDVATSWRISGDIYCSWQRVREIIDESLYLSAFARNGHYNDMDMLEVGRTLSQTEDETHMAIWCMMASPLLIGCDLENLRPETFRLLSNKALIGINQDPLGRQAYVVRADTTGGYILAKDLHEARGLERAAAFYNPTDNEISMEISAEELELAEPVKIYDAIKQKELPGLASEINVTLAPHATNVFIIKGEKRLLRRKYEAESAYLGGCQELYNPLLVGSAYHIRDNRLSGGAGVANAGITPENDIVWDEVAVPRGDSYELTIHYLPRQTSDFYISIDGRQGYAIAAKAEGNGLTLATVTIPISEGVHKIRLYSDDVMPVIDCLEIKL